MVNIAAITPPNPSDAETLLSNIAVLAFFVSCIGAGILRGIKEAREFRKAGIDSDGSKTPSQIAAAMLMETVTLSEWSRSNQDVKAALDRQAELMLKQRDDHIELRHAIVELTHVLRSKG